MPLLLLNLRAQPSGLESHRKFLEAEAVSWLGERDQADITFICTSSSEGAIPVHLTGHQAVLAPLSPLLRDVCTQHSCGHHTQMVHITVQADPQVMKSLLTLVYRGATTLHTTAVEELKNIVKMLNLTFPGGFERVVGSKVPPPYPYPSPTKKQVVVKRPRELSPSIDTKKLRATTDSGTAVMSSKASPPTKASATDRMNMHVSMTLLLKDAPTGSTATCKMPQCGAEVTYEQLSDHFLVHETSDGNSGDGSLSFPCVACGISFKYRKELDIHTKNKHGGGSTSLRDKLDLLSDSDTSEEESLEQLPLKEKASVVCQKCRKVLPSSFHMSPSKHDCSFKTPSSSDQVLDPEADNYCKLCNHTFKTTKAKNVHMQMKHSKNKKTPTPRNALLEAKSVLGISVPNASTWKKYGCQICTKRFDEFCRLRTHYTLHHFWDSLSEEYKNMGDECIICMKKFPTGDHLVQHMGNFHCVIDKYLVKKGLRIISEEKTVKLLSWKCECCQLNLNSSAALKSHLAVKHYQKELNAEFPVEGDKVKKCPKCHKIFEGSSISTVVAHIGSFHDEVIKYCMEKLDLHEEDKCKIPVDDFDDGAIGVPIDKNIYANKCAICGCTCETRSDLKNHYLDTHYVDHFMKQFPVPFCQQCEQEFIGLPELHKHIVFSHEAIFLSVLSKDGFSLPAHVSPRRKKEVAHKGTFDFLFCQICFQEVQSSKTLKIHYIRHFQLHFQQKYFTDLCPFCEKKFESIMITQKHIATDHSEKSLIPLMEKANLWVDKSIILNPVTRKMKRIGIQIKKLDKSVVLQHFDELGLRDLHPQTERKHCCAFPSCDKVFEKRDQFLTHLAISHFWKDLTLEFGTSFKEDAMNCPVCKERINPNMDKTTFYKHLAVAHEIVMKYVQNITREDTVFNHATVTKPPSSSTDVPLLRVSKEAVVDEPRRKSVSLSDRDSEIDRILKKHGASSLVDGITVNTESTSEAANEALDNIRIKEEITTEENMASATSSALLSKIRNVFSDESDSD